MLKQNRGSERGGGGGVGGPHVGCRLKFQYFVGCPVKIFDLCRFSVDHS